MISVLALDLDETLVRSDDTISPRTLALLQAWADAGNHIVIATGRPPRRTRVIHDSLHVHPWVCYNGATIFEDGTPVYNTSIAAADAAMVVAAFMDAAPDCWVGLECDDCFYFNRPQSAYGDAIYVQDIRTMSNQAASKIYLPLDHYRRVADLLPPLPSHLRLLTSEKYNVAQVMPLTVSKAAGLKFLAQRWGYTMQQVMAFGDDTNDIEMIQEAGVGVAMGNAVPELKAVANRITLTNDEDGVAVVIAELMGV